MQQVIKSGNQGLEPYLIPGSSTLILRYNESYP